MKEVDPRGQPFSVCGCDDLCNLTAHEPQSSDLRRARLLLQCVQDRRRFNS